MIEIRNFDATDEKLNKRSKWESQLGVFGGAVSSFSPQWDRGENPEKCLRLYAIYIQFEAVS